VTKDAILMTDEFPLYIMVGRKQAEHHAVNHKRKEYARGRANTNSAESFFALLKRGMYGNFHHCGKKHLQRYCDEFAFRWNNRKVDDSTRRNSALSMAEGKRLTYR
jgi:hypothetical protein